MINFSPIKLKLIATILGVVIAISALFFGFLWYKTATDFKDLSSKYLQERKIVSFISLFVDNMLGSDKEISFNDRLEMENAVREINDQAILDCWQKFTDSQAEDDATTQARTLLKLLINKLSH